MGPTFSRFGFRKSPHGLIVMTSFSHHLTNLNVSKGFLEPQSIKQDRDQQQWLVIYHLQDSPRSVARSPEKAKYIRAIPYSLWLFTEEDSSWILNACCGSVTFTQWFSRCSPQGPEVLLLCLRGHCEHQEGEVYITGFHLFWGNGFPVLKTFLKPLSKASYTPPPN